MVDKILERHAVRITPMRQLVLEYFIEKDMVLGLKDLEEAFPKSDKITIYRTLKTFEEKGIIHGINNVGEIKYARCKGFCDVHHHVDWHPHFQCDVCLGVVCVDDAPIPNIELPQGYQWKSTTVMITGVCPDCTG